MKLFRDRSSQRTDEELMIEVIERHSHPAITELHRRYSKKLLGYFIRMLNRDEEQAGDFVQELFLRILEKKHLYDPEKKFYTWVFTIASNMCKTSYRRSPMQSLTPENEHRGGFSLGDDLAETERFHAALREGLDRLEHMHKTAFILRYMEQFSLNEIAEITETGVGTVKSRLFYATRKMTEHLKAYDPKNETNLFKLH